MSLPELGGRRVIRRHWTRLTVGVYMFVCAPARAFERGVAAVGAEDEGAT